MDDAQLFADAEEPRLRIRGGAQPAEDRPVARVLLESPLPHLDRLFDYAVTQEQADEAVIGARVRVRFSGRKLSGFIVERTDTTDVDGELAPLASVVSPLPVLGEELYGLCQAVAARFAGTTADVVRLGVPARHARGEKNVLKSAPGDPDGAAEAARAVLEAPPADHVPAAEADYLAALKSWAENANSSERSEPEAGPRGAYTVLPGDSGGVDWVRFGLEAAARVIAEGRTVLWLVPDYRELEAVKRQLGALGEFTSVLSADQGPEARWAAWVRVLTGRSRLVLGMQAAAFAPMQSLGLILMFDDGNDSYLFGRAPYAHARFVLQERVRRTGAALLFLDRTRTVDVQFLIGAGWVGELRTSRQERRESAPVVFRPQTERSISDLTQLPEAVFSVIRGGLGRAKSEAAVGPVLVQVPRTGYSTFLTCTGCGNPALCPSCEAPLSAAGPEGPFACARCGWHIEQLACRSCRSRRFSFRSAGLDGIHAQLGRAFPGFTVVRSGGSKIFSRLDAPADIVVASTGAEPYVDGGYAAAVLLDTLWPGPVLRATDRAIARRMRAAAMVRPSRAGGRVLILDDDPDVVRTLTRWDPEVYAAGELADRTEAGFPPAWRTAEVTGARQAVEDVAESCCEEFDARLYELRDGPPRSRFTRPGDEVDESVVTAVLGIPASTGSTLSEHLAAETASRSMRGDVQIRVRMDDPDAL